MREGIEGFWVGRTATGWSWTERPERCCSRSSATSRHITCVLLLFLASTVVRLFVSTCTRPLSAVVSSISSDCPHLQDSSALIIESTRRLIHLDDMISSASLGGDTAHATHYPVVRTPMTSPCT